MSDCIFCKIINKEMSTEIIYEDENIISFKDINPVAPIHVLVVPKKHIEKVTDIKPEDGILIQKAYEAINNIAKTQEINEKGFRVIINCGEDGGQVVNHLHFHLLGGKQLGPKIVH